ncbi:29928_t:CDS:1, partial [Racocetra persica]
AEIKGGTMPCEKFAVIAGSEQESLSFYSTFFTDNIKFKKGDIYQLSTSGSLVQDSSEIVQGISNGSYEFEKSFPSLLIKELWESNQENIEELDLLKKEFEDKKKYVDGINEDLHKSKEET